jgi:DNA polymerase-3 subunit epsilon
MTDQERVVCFDTETTGLNYQGGDRVVEIACVEVIDLMPTGKTWHAYVNPERDMPLVAFDIHGLSTEFLSDKSVFEDVVDGFLEFVGECRLVAHNAPFDMGFINMELKRIGRPALTNLVTDTVALAKIKFPGGRVSLDELCRKFGIDLSARTKHEAMLDTQLLASVYMELRGGRHRAFDLDNHQDLTPIFVDRPFRESRHIGVASSLEVSEHEKFLKGLSKYAPKGSTDHLIWKRLSSEAEF